jgi:O-antigen/teichoic acid export membrane protein
MFGEAYSLASLFLVLVSVVSLFCGLGSLSMGSLLSSQGETKVILKIGLLTMAVGIPSSLILIPYFGVLGFILNSLIAQAVGNFLYIYWIRKLFKFKMWIGQSARTFIAAFMMGSLVWATSVVLRLWVGVSSDAILLGVGFLFGFFSYLLLLPLIGAIDSMELENLNDILGKSGPFKPIFNILFVIMKRLISIRTRTRS